MRVPAAFAIALAVLVTAGCARHPTAPVAATYAVSGQVELLGHETSVGGPSTGITRVVSDPTGVPVEIALGSHVLARTTTQAGHYRFAGLSPAGYVVRATGFGPVADEVPVTVAAGDVPVRTMRLASAGDLYPTPNPMQDVPVSVYFGVTQAGPVLMRVTDLGGNLVQVLVNGSMPPGRYSAAWNGLDGASTPEPAGYYWVTFESGADRRAQLIIR